MRYNAAMRILQRMDLLGEKPQRANEIVLRDMSERLTYKAGAITLSAKGEVGIYFTSRKMAWSYRKGNTIYSGIRPGDNYTEDA